MVLRKGRTTARGTAWAGCWAWITWCHVFYKVQRITTPSYWIICKIWTLVFGRDAFKVTLFIKMNKSSQVPVPSFNNFWTRYWDPPSFLLNPFSSSFLPLFKINVNRWVSEHICLENNDIASILFVAPFLPTRLPLGLRGCIVSDNALPRAPLTYFNDGGVRRIFLGLTFWPTGIFLGSRKQHRDFLGYCIFHQLKSTIT